MRINEIRALDVDMLCKVLTSTKITELEKTRFVLNNRVKIKEILTSAISDVDFKTLMKNRTLQKFRPLKNSYTKWGDKIILAKALGMKVIEIPGYIRKVNENLKKLENLTFLPPDKLEMIKTYIYRHGNKDELVTFLDYELANSNDMVKTLYRTLEYYNGGVADYFIRPIHRMDNKTLVRIYGIIDKNIKLCQKEGKFSEAESKKVAKWALVRILQIQNNSKLINAVKTYDVLK